MQRLLLTIDRISTFVGKAFAWSIMLLTLVIVWEVVARYVFRAPTGWGFDASYMLYGALFMMGGAYALSRGAHVRGDFLYRGFSPRTQAALDLVLYVVFFLPGMMALLYSGWKFFELSYAMNERSSFSPDGPIVWPFKALIPVAGILMLLQGAAEIARCVVCLRTGRWPPRLTDVEELERELLARAEIEAAEAAGERPGAGAAR
jgi:TRAP-type mannitol/chloroaromatic compound transport system permease small subunit